MSPARIYLSAPDVREAERKLLMEAVDSNWIAPVGPALERFEEELAERADRRFCIGLSSGTAGLHLALIAAGVRAGDEVLCSTLTFVATANAIHHCGATPVFIDSEEQSWNMDPELLEAELVDRSARDALPAAVVVVDLYGQTALYGPIEATCSRFGIPLVEDAAEGLGALHADRPAGNFGQSAIYSFNGNKIITASGGGALVTDDPGIADRVRHLATQAREPAVHYEHVDRGFNYRLSNLLAAFATGQLATLDDRIERRRWFNGGYRRFFADRDGIEVLTEAPGNRSTYWLTVVAIDEASAGISGESIRIGLEAQNIESRPVWKPMHRQPAYRDCRAVLNGASDRLFDRGLCLPSGSGMSDADFERVLSALTSVLR